MPVLTFLFTDIEGSTGLAQRLGVDYSAQLERHNTLVRDVVVDGGGVEVKTTGDGFFAVFVDARRAVDAAGEIQRAISAATWPEGGEIRVRIGIHTGEAEEKGGDYLGLEVNRASRIAASGHGGQVVLSSATRAILSSAVETKDLGSHLLRGLETAEPLHQLVISGLPVEFPPLRTAASATNNLPARAAAIIGRDEDLRSLEHLVSSHRLVTVLGPAGVGKTSLALAAASRMVDRFTDGVVFVDLSAVTDPALMTTTIAKSVGVQPTTTEALVERLKSANALLVIDNLEQLVTGADDIEAILDGTSTTRVLATSQVPLRISGEQRYLLAPLEVNGDSESPGVELFFQRAQATTPGYVANPEDVRALVARLDGLPLAIELAAARSNFLTPAEMLDRIESAGLTGRGEGRHQSLENAISWSYHLLDPVDQMTLRHLGVFAGGISLGGAEKLLAGSTNDPLASISELIDRSLLTRDLGSSGRLRMLDSIRRFAVARLAASAEHEAVVDRYLELFCAMADEAYPGLQSDRGEWWRARLDDELDNVRDVLTRLHGRGERDRGLNLLGSTWRYFHSRGHLTELDLWLGRFFGLESGDGSAVGVVKGLMARGALRYWQRAFQDALADYEKAVNMARELAEPSLLADALFGLATSLILNDDAEMGREWLAEAMGLYVDLNDPGGQADVVAAEAFATLMTDGLVGLDEVFAESERLYEAAGRSINTIQTLYARTAVAIAEDRLEDARFHCRTALANGHELGDMFLIVWGVEYMALIEIEAGDLERGGTLLGAADEARKKIGGGWGPAAAGLEEGQVVLSRLVGEERARSLIDGGRGLSLEEGRQLALVVS
ncbi:MAG: adenylate/guanylate cyclase domain-containing protein [Actinobacteria bacterium]|nr:adenylate/guanylate cyclase domain-containing protein [Actinomycetota bacterium]